MKHFRSQTESLENTRSECVDKDIRLGDEPFGGRESGWILRIEHYRAFTLAECVVGGRGGWSVDAGDRGTVVCENKTGERSWCQSRELPG